MTNSSLKIDKGRLFFHFNPKLCLQKIEAFANATGKRDFTEFEVAANGDKIACTYLIIFSSILNYALNNKLFT